MKAVIYLSFKALYSGFDGIHGPDVNKVVFAIIQDLTIATEKEQT